MDWTNIKSTTGPLVVVELDKLDLDILRVLLGAADLSHREVARRVGASPTTVGERLKGLREAGLIQGATLRLAPGFLPGQGRWVRGRLAKGESARVLSGVEGVPGVTEAAVARDGSFMAIIVVRDLEGEEAVLARLAELGVEGATSTSVKRATGPPLLHLFQETVGLAERCAVCKNETTKPLQESVDGRRVVFCCPSCRSIYMERYERLARGARSA